MKNNILPSVKKTINIVNKKIESFSINPIGIQIMHLAELGQKENLINYIREQAIYALDEDNYLDGMIMSLVIIEFAIQNTDVTADEIPVLYNIIADIDYVDYIDCSITSVANSVGEKFGWGVAMDFKALVNEIEMQHKSLKDSNISNIDLGVSILGLD